MPLTAAKIGLRSWRRVYSVRSKSWRWRSQSSLVMSLRWRRSLPTENARSPAPVMMTTRTEVRTATVSRAWVRRAPISVVIALSAFGRLSVTTATRSSETNSSSTGDSGSAAPADGGPKSSAFQRSVPVGLVAMSSPFLGIELGQPVQGAQPGGEEVLAAARDDERRQALQPVPDRPVGDGERPGPVVRADERIFLGGSADEDPVVGPLRLDELELTLDVRSGEDEDDPAILAVVVEHPGRQRRAIARAAPDHAVQPDVDAHLVLERVARVGSARVGAGRALEAAQVVAVREGVVAPRVR